jgi:hypothetical protein
VSICSTVDVAGVALRIARLNAFGTTTTVKGTPCSKSLRGLVSFGYSTLKLIRGAVGLVALRLIRPNGTESLYASSAPRPRARSHVGAGLGQKVVVGQYLIERREGTKPVQTSSVNWCAIGLISRC